MIVRSLCPIAPVLGEMRMLTEGARRARVDGAALGLVLAVRLGDLVSVDAIAERGFQVARSQSVRPSTLLDRFDVLNARPRRSPVVRAWLARIARAA